MNYCVQAFEVPSIFEKDAAKIQLVSQLLSNTFLHEQIREKAGAYGGGSFVNNKGIMAFYSYRDPNILRTFKVYLEAFGWLNKTSLTEQHLLEAKLALFGKLDQNSEAQKQGLDLFLYGIFQFFICINLNKGIDNQLKDKFREIAIKSELKELLQYFKEYFKDKLAQQKYSKVAFGNCTTELEKQLTNEGWKVQKPLE